MRWGIAGTALAAAAACAAIMLLSVLAGAPSSSARGVHPSSPPAGVVRLPATAKAVLLRAARATAAIPDLFRALSQFKGIKVIDHASTLAGRKGIGVAAYDPSRGTLDELIFDPKTYLYIGDSEIALNSTYMPKGTVNGNAVQQIAVVDKPGQLP